MAFLIGGANSAADTGFDVDNSCRFNSADSAYMHKTMGTPTSQKKFTISMWLKRGTGFAAEQTPFHIRDGSGSEQYDTGLMFEVDSQLRPVWDNRGAPNGRLITNQMFRDPSAWYHIVYAVDTTQATGSNRQKLYVNGSQVTSFAEETIPSENGDNPAMASGNIITLGRNEHDDNDYYDGYMAEVVFIDGLQLAPTSFGEFDEDSPRIWKPIDVSGLTFGNNGFYLDFEDSSNLGNDKNGGTDFTEVNLAAADSATDTPTNNFCTINPLNKTDLTFSQGNCKLVCSTTSSAHRMYKATFGLTTGKWFWELKPVHVGSSFGNVGIIDDVGYDEDDYLGNETYGYSYRPDGKKYNAGSGTTYGDTWTDDDVIGVALNMDDNELKFYKNGTVQNSGTAISISTTPTTYVPAGSMIKDSTNPDYEYNFGGCSAFTVSSGNSDANGYGNFEFAVPSGFFALCTKNLAEYG